MRTQAIEDCRYCPDPRRVAATSSALTVHVAAFLALMIPISAIEIPKLSHEDPIIHTWFVPPDQHVVVQPIPVPPIKSPPRQHVRVEPAPPTAPTATNTDPGTDVVPVSPDLDTGLDATPIPQYEAPAPSVSITCIVCVKPIYPRAELARGIQGETLVRLRIGSDGSPIEIKLERSSGNVNLDRAALDAVRKWRFAPAQQAGVPVEVDATVPVKFSILSG